MPVRLVTAPASEPISLAEAKAHLRLDTPLDDGYVLALIAAARSYAEEVCWRGLVTQTWELVLRGFIGEDRFELRTPHYLAPYGYVWCGNDRFTDYIELPRGHVGTLLTDAVKYIDENGTQQTLDSSVYSLDDVSVPGRLHLAPGKTWPNTRPQWDAVRIRYPVGWAANAVPAPIRQAMLLLISQMYEHRTPEVAGLLSSVQFSVDALLQPYRLVRL